MVLELKLRALHKLIRVLYRRDIASASFLFLIFYCHFFVHMDVYVCVHSCMCPCMFVCMWRPGNNFGHCYSFMRHPPFYFLLLGRVSNGPIAHQVG